MDIYLCGGVNANLKPLWQAAYKLGGVDLILYLAGSFSRPYCIEEWFRIRDGIENGKIWKETGLYDESIKQTGPFILESFFYADDFTEKMIPHFGKFLLDSGAFTLFSDPKRGKDIVWEEYVDRYADFIVRNKVELFFEVDIDKLVGYKKVLELRNRLERRVGRQCIPVWHKFRGLENFDRMVQEYKYVAIGGIVSKEIKQESYRYFPYFIDKAHRSGAKIHGLGFTSLEGITKYHFDSVDSTAWTAGNRFGIIYRFDGKTMRKTIAPPNTRLKDPRAAAIHNFNEWVKFQKYAEVNL